MPRCVQVLFHVSAAAEKTVIFHLTGDTVAGVTAINSVRELRAAKRLLGLQLAQPDRLADRASELNQLA